ncbi:MAG: hypothetical protein NDI61_06250 [Bdellovibrionaceae bacterium]|nr:hypothetical protein [Pseudobdellovibrionaceae bacterium]
MRFDMRYILYLNLWGTLEKLRDAPTDDSVFHATEFHLCQEHFLGILTEIASRSPKIQLFHSIDSAYAVCSSADAALDVAQQVFHASLLNHARFVFWPLRGAIACDDGATALSESLRPTLPNLQTHFLFGQAPIEAANLEKTAQKGMRLFLSERAALGAKRLHLRTCSTRGLLHEEACWAQGLTNDLRDHMKIMAERLFEKNSNYARQMGASLDDLLEWSK